MHTVWKFDGFCIIHILREFSFEDSRSAKSAILTHLEALNFDFYEFLHFLVAELYPSQKFRALEIAKMAFFELLHPQKLILHNLSDRNCWAVSHCCLAS